MRVKLHLMAMAVGAGIVWFTHPTEGERRREEARKWIDGIEVAFRRMVDGTSTEGATLAGPATLADVIDVAKRSGFGADFSTTPDARVRCGECGHESEPADVERAWMHRLEGTSDPDDLMAVSALRCPSCGARGLLVMPFGPSANDVEGQVSRRLPDPQNADMAPLRDLRVAV